ncbi:MAG: hypothetical protein ABIJ73_10020 [Pseudomonadota bacterium]
MTKFRVPKSVKIGACRYAIRLPPENRARALRGEILIMTHVINLDPDLPRTWPSTLLHEIQHALEDQLGLDFDESTTTRVAWGWAGVIADNPGLFRALADALGGDR